MASDPRDDPRFNNEPQRFLERWGALSDETRTKILNALKARDKQTVLSLFEISEQEMKQYVAFLAERVMELERIYPHVLKRP